MIWQKLEDSEFVRILRGGFRAAGESRFKFKSESSAAAAPGPGRRHAAAATFATA
jgi:hypothetical protein